MARCRIQYSSSRRRKARTLAPDSQDPILGFLARWLRSSLRTHSRWAAGYPHTHKRRDSPPRKKLVCLGRRFGELACRELRNGLIIRDLPGQLRELGFNHIIIRPEVEVAENLDAFYTWFVEPSLNSPWCKELISGKGGGAAE